MKRFLCRSAVLAAGAILLTAELAAAQTVLDPRTAEFAPSPDHYAVYADGTAVVQEYALTIFASGTTQPYETVNLGKPMPDPDGLIRVDFVSLLSIPLQPSVVYVARVDAVGGAGSSSSSDSNTFAISSSSSTTCSPAISPTSASIPSTGGSITATVTVASGCPWTAASNDGWITVSTGQSGTGSGTAQLSVAANPVGSSRMGSATVATRVLTIQQDPGPCSYALSPAGQSFAASGGSGAFTVAAGTACTWTAVPSANWITVAGSATGNGTVSFTVAANSTLTARAGAIAVNGATFNVTQDAMTCSYSIAPTSQSIGAAASSGSFSVTAPAACSWTAVPQASWLTIATGATGAGSSTVNFTAAANTSTSPRTSVIAVAGQTLTVNQAGNGCTFALTPANLALPSSGGVALVDMSAPSGCAWTAASGVDWVTVSSGASGSGSGTITISAAPNGGTTARNGVLSAGGQTVTLSEEAAVCSYSVTPTSDFPPYSGGSDTIAVTTGAGCAWTATTDVNWITITTTAGGSGSGSVAYTVLQNPTGVVRTGTITVAGQTVTIKQRKAPASKRG